VGVKAIEEHAELEIDEGDAKDAWHDAAIPPFRHRDCDSAQAARLFGNNRSYAHESFCRKKMRLGYLLGSYSIAAVPESNSTRLTSFKSTTFDSPASNVGP